MQTRRGGGDLGHVVDALRGLQNGVNQNRFLNGVARLQLGQVLVDEMNVPRPFDFRQHDDVELVADLADQSRHVVEKPRRIQSVYARPETRRAEISGARHRDQAFARRDLRFDRDRVFQIAENHVDPSRQFVGLGADLFIVRRHEMDHPLEPHRQFAVRGGRANGERLEELARGFHEGLRDPAARSKISASRRRRRCLGPLPRLSRAPRKV